MYLYHVHISVLMYLAKIRIRINLPHILKVEMFVWNSIYISWLLVIPFLVGLRTFQHPFFIFNNIVSESQNSKLLKYFMFSLLTLCSFNLYLYSSFKKEIHCIWFGLKWCIFGYKNGELFFFPVFQRSWDVALGPVKQVPMNIIIMWMAGNSISIFPIMMVGMMFFRPIQALISIQNSEY